DFAGRKRGQVLTGVAVGRNGTHPSFEVVDAAGAVWTVRPFISRVTSRRQGWTWEPTEEERVVQLLPRLLELVVD
ncbi:MAG: hypothetical protein ACRDZW_03195, partial [Acidimicrobiales bacterium]